MTLSRSSEVSLKYRCTRLSTDCSRRYRDAYHVAITQYRYNRLPSKLTEALEFLELVIELDSMFYGSNSIIASEDRSLYLRVKQGPIP